MSVAEKIGETIGPKPSRCPDVRSGQEYRCGNLIVPQNGKCVKKSIRPAVVKGENAVSPAGIQGAVVPTGQDLIQREHGVMGPEIPDLLFETRLGDVHSGLNEKTGWFLIGKDAMVHQNMDSSPGRDCMQPEAVVAGGEGSTQSEFENGARG
jgi:hypothetical protein